MLKISNIFENINTGGLIKDIAELLNQRYERTTGTISNGLDLKKESAFENKVSGEIDNMTQVVSNLTIKYPKIKKEYLAQVTKDWYNQEFSNGNFILTKGVVPYKEF